MDAINYTDLRKNLKSFLDKVYNNHEPLIITRKNNENIVLLSIDDYNSFMETIYLLSNTSNSKRILSSLESARNGKTFEKELIDV